jgi:hypothetical protein
VGPPSFGTKGSAAAAALKRLRKQLPHLTIDEEERR